MSAKFGSVENFYSEAPLVVHRTAACIESPMLSDNIQSLLNPVQGDT